MCFVGQVSVQKATVLIFICLKLDVFRQLNISAAQNIKQFFLVLYQALDLIGVLLLLIVGLGCALFLLGDLLSWDLF